MVKTMNRTQILNMLCTALLYVGLATASVNDVALSIDVSRGHFKVGESIVLTILIINPGNESVYLPQPSVDQKTLSIELSRDGQVVPAQMKWGTN